MTSGQKVASSLLISVIAFSVFTVVAFSGLFDLVEVNFYQPLARQIKEQKLNELESAQNEYLEILMTRFNIFEMNSDVKTYVDLRPSDEAVQSREKIRSELMTNTTALLGLRIVDDNGKNVYFSTFETDRIKNAKTGSVSYRNYNTLEELPYDYVKSSDWVVENAAASDKARIIKEPEKNRLVFALPFYDAKNSFKGTILFYCDAGHFNRYLFSRNLIDVNGFAVLVAAGAEDKDFDPGFGGFIFGLPNYGLKSAETQILAKWKENPDETFWKIVSEKNEKLEGDEAAEKNEENSSLCVFSKKGSRTDAGFIAAIYDEKELKFPPYMRLLLLSAAFITFYLVVFLAFSFKHDDIVVIRDRIKGYKKQFIKAYKKLSDIENDRDLNSHRKNFEERVKKSLGRLASKYESEVNTLIEKCWNEILLELGKSYAISSGDNIVVNKQELRAMLEDILGSGKLKVQAVSVDGGLPEASSTVHSEEPVETVEGTIEREETEPEIIEETQQLVEAVEENESVEEIEEVEDAEEVPDAEEVEEAEAVEEIEEVEEAEEVSDAEEVEEAEAVEEIEEIEDAEEVSDAEEVEEAEAVEEIEEVEEAEEVDEAEAVEEIEEIEDAEEVSDAEEVEEAEAVEEIEEIEDAEEVPDAEEVEEAETVEEIEEVEEAEEVSDAEEVEEAESVEEIEEVEDAEEVSDAEEFESIDVDNYISDLPDENTEEVLNSLEEKLDFGVPDAEAPSENNDDFLDDFATVSLDYAFLDETDMSEDDMYKIDSYEEISDNFAEESNSVSDNNTAVSDEALSDSEEHSEAEEKPAEELPEELSEPEVQTDELPEELPEELPSDENTEDYSVLEELEQPEESMPFTFTQLAANNTSLEELSSVQPDTIVQNSDGTYTIADKSAYNSSNLDQDFKKLVDSVLR